MAGRPRKAGKRTASGRLKRNNYPEFTYVRGSEWVQAMQARFGTHYNTALGRAYAAGLLGEGTEALNRYQAGKKFARLWRWKYGGDAYRCALDDTPRGGHDEIHANDDREHDHKWLKASADSLDVSGLRPYFDALISSLNVDSGPFWLDSLLAGSKDARDKMLLAAAIRALDIIAPEAKPVRIVSAVY